MYIYLQQCIWAENMICKSCPQSLDNILYILNLFPPKSIDILTNYKKFFMNQQD
jgi:hypothetical protein